MTGNLRICLCIEDAKKSFAGEQCLDFSSTVTHAQVMDSEGRVQPAWRVKVEFVNLSAQRT